MNKLCSLPVVTCISGDSEGTSIPGSGNGSETSRHLFINRPIYSVNTQGSKGIRESPMHILNDDTKNYPFL